MGNLSLRIPPLDDKVSPWAWAFFGVLLAQYVIGSVAVGIVTNTLWPGTFIALAALPCAFLIRTRWAIRRWPFLGPVRYRGDQQMAEQTEQLDLDALETLLMATSGPPLYYSDDPATASGNKAYRDAAAKVLPVLIKRLRKARELLTLSIGICDCHKGRHYCSYDSLVEQQIKTWLSTTKGE